MPSLNLTPQQITMLSVGIGIVFALYVLIKVISWFANSMLSRARSASQQANEPRHGRRSQAQSAQVEKRSGNQNVNPLSASQPSVGFEKTKLVHPLPEKLQPATSPVISREEKSAPFEFAPVGITADAEHSIAEASGSATSTTFGAGTNRRTQTSSHFWPTEPKHITTSNLFEDVGAEYPYATGEDYRYGAITPALSELLPFTEEGRKETTRVLRNAGYFEPHAWQNFAALRYVAIVLPLILVGLLLVLSPERFEPFLVAMLVIAPGLGWALPALYIRSKAAERLRQIELAMPDMLDLLNMCVSQGMNVTQALHRISREFSAVYPALSKELQIVSEQAKVGTLTQALNNFSQRVDVPEVHSFTSLLIQTEQMGTSVTEALIDYSDSMRESQRQRADEKANSATFKLLFPTVLCLMPAVFLLLMGPAIIELNNFWNRGGVSGLNQQINQEQEVREQEVREQRAQFNP